MKTDLIIKMAWELNEMWDDINGNLSVSADFCVYWLWKKYNEKASFSDCLEAYKLARL